MKRIKIVSYAYGWNYQTDEEMKTLTEELPWTEVDDKFYKRLIEALPYACRLGRHHPFYNKNLYVIEDVTTDPINLEKFISECEEAGAKAIEEERKRQAAAAAAAEKRKQDLVKKKQKQLEKLKAELGEVDNKTT